MIDGEKFHFVFVCQLTGVRISSHRCSECWVPADIFFPRFIFPMLGDIPTSLFHRKNTIIWAHLLCFSSSRKGLYFPTAVCFRPRWHREHIVSLAVIYFRTQLSLCTERTAPPKWNRPLMACAPPSAKCLAVATNKTICYWGESTACHGCNVGRHSLPRLLRY